MANQHIHTYITYMHAHCIHIYIHACMPTYIHTYIEPNAWDSNPKPSIDGK